MIKFTAVCFVIKSAQFVITAAFCNKTASCNKILPQFCNKKKAASICNKVDASCNNFLKFFMLEFSDLFLDL